MTSFDFVVFFVIGISVVVSVFRGLVKEVLSLLAWLLAFWVAKSYSVDLVSLLPDAIPTESLRFLAAFLILFFATLLIFSLLGIALSQVVAVVGLGWLDRILGGCFGLIRGVFVACLMVMLAGLTSLPQQPAWQAALLSAPLEALVLNALPWLPSPLAQKINFE